MFVMYGTWIVFFTEQGLGFMQPFETTDYLIGFMIGATSAMLQVCRVKAAQYEEPAKLAVVNYF